MYTEKRRKYYFCQFECENCSYITVIICLAKGNSFKKVPERLRSFTGESGLSDGWPHPQRNSAKHLVNVFVGVANHNKAQFHLLNNVTFQELP